MKSYLSADSIEVEQEEMDIFPIETANELKPSGCPLHRLNLKLGTIVMLLINIDVARGLCNGTRLQITRMMQDMVEARIISGKFMDKLHLFTRVPFKPDEVLLDIRLTRTQLPFRLAFAMTFNKSQGQTLDKVGLLLKEPVFSHGQLYTAFSRVRRRDAIKVKINDIPYADKRQGRIKNRQGVFTRNIVYKEILQVD